MATRSQSLRQQGVELERYQTAARGVGDIFFTTRRWMFDPDTHPGGNLQLGVGVKIPTGQNNSTDTFRVLSGNTITNQIRTVDQSIQPGDGGFGILVDVQHVLGAGRREDVGLRGRCLSLDAWRKEQRPDLPHRNRAKRSCPSPTSTWRAAAWRSRCQRLRDMTFSGGLRLEGVPVRDIIGGDTGFRRPGIAVSIEPAVNMIVKGKNAITVAVPMAIYRNRFQSVPDKARGAHGDAAFADYLILAGYSRRF